MKFKTVSIATAKIKGIDERPYYSDHFCWYVWDINFSDPSTLFVKNLTFIKCANTKGYARVVWKKFKENFNTAGIHDGDKVAVMSDYAGDVMAIGRIGADVWIDVRDKFKIKKFADFNIVVRSLIVH